MKQSYVPFQRTISLFKLLLPLVCLLTLVALPAAARGQSFRSIPALNFSTTFGLDNPLPQVITPASTGAAFAFSATASTTSGGAWLTITPGSYGCCGVTTPYPITVMAAPAVTLAAGTYTGKITLTPASTTIPTVTIPVTLVVHAPTDTYFDQAAGGLTFSLATRGGTPPGQGIQVRNAGAGSLAWTSSVSTADGGAWLKLSAASGTAPSSLTVSVVPANLPGGALVAGTFTGQILLKAADDKLTIPVTVNVGASVFPQVNPLNFTKIFGGPNPLAQVITLTTTETNFAFFAAAVNSTGGSWLTVTPSSYGCCGANTPQAVTVAVNPAVTLAAGSYMAEIIAVSADGHQKLSIPVTLMVEPATAASFDNVAGALNFSLATNGDTPPAQDVQIRNAGAGSLAWTASATTADGGSWLTLSTPSGTAPSTLSVSIDPAKLPDEALVAGTFVGQVVLQSASSRVTIPVSAVVGANVFRQVDPLYFTKAFGGANPLAQVITIASTGAAFAFNAVTVNGTGGSWLTINPSSYGCCGINTPQAITASVNPAVNLAAGTYTAEIVAKSEAGDQSLTIPVTLVIEPATTPFFDALPGQMSFFMLTKGNAPPPQELPIRDAGSGSVEWTATTTTSDGGAWLSIAPTSGITPSTPSVSVNPANLPGGGLVAGTFTGQVVLENGGQLVSVPVSMVVGANVFRQSNPLNFAMVAGGANPLPQIITMASTGTNFAFFATTANSTGGSWLSITPSSYGCCGVNTPEAIKVSVAPAANLAAGTYSSEIIIKSADGTQGLTVPVTLTIAAKTAASFDSLPGQLTYSMLTGGTAPPQQPLEIRNAGAGSLAWTASLSTSDGASWLAISSASGTAPSVPMVSVIPANLPGGGLIAGTFTGQVVLNTSGDRVTVPVSFVVGASVFRQVNGLDFNKVFGGANPLPQLINIASTGTAFPFFATVATSTGGNWLSITPSSYGCCGINTPVNMVVTVNPAVTLAAGKYTAEIILQASAGSPSIVIPVTLTINPATATFFDDIPGAVTFFQATGGANPAGQKLPIRNAGAGTLDWTSTVSTSDGAKWLSLSSTSGTAPSSPTVSIVSANLPGKGLVAGIYNGQIVLTAGTGRQTIPVSVVVGANVFKPVAPLSFSEPAGGPNPASQAISLASTGANFAFFGQAANGNGRTWLKISPSSFGCCGLNTPLTLTTSVSPATTLAAGSYLGEIILTSSAGDQGMVVPVTLTIDGTAAAATPTFTPAGGTYTSSQSVTILDATRGSSFYYTTDGTTPTTSSNLYKIPISVTTTGTVIKAIAIAPGFNQSAVGSATYTLTLPPAATPASTQTVTIAETTPGATVYYTTNGSTPTTSSTKYTGPIVFTTSAVLKFIAVAPGFNPSAVRTVTVTVQ